MCRDHVAEFAYHSWDKTPPRVPFRVEHRVLGIVIDRCLMPSCGIEARDGRYDTTIIDTTDTDTSSCSVDTATVFPSSCNIRLQERERVIPNQLQVIRRVTSGHLSAAADSKTSPRNPVMCFIWRILQA